MLVVVIFSMGYLSLCCGQVDPCESSNHKLFPQDNFGSRNEKCKPKVTSRCDFYFVSAWYVVYNSTLLNQCPTTGYCGTTYPVWMDGTFPDTSDGIVNRTACIKHGHICCDSNVTMMIKNCTSFYVYHFVPLPTCPMAYCFVSDLPCEPAVTTSKVVPTTVLSTEEPTTEGDSSSTTKRLHRDTTVDGTIFNGSGENYQSIEIVISVGLFLMTVIGIVGVGCMRKKKMLCKTGIVSDSSSTGSQEQIKDKN